MIITSPANDRRIPTLLGLGLVVGLVAIVAFTTRAVQNVTKLFSQAETPTTPNSVTIANLSDTTATVYWSTDQPTSGAVFYGKNSNLGDGVSVDDRDLSSASSKYPTHFARLINLQPNTKYFFKVGVNGTSFGDSSKNQAPFELNTGPALTAPAVIDPIFGKVVDLTGAPASGVIAVFESPDSTKIAALSKSDGSYVLPIGNARTTNLESYPSFSPGQTETITLVPGGSNSPATITCVLGQDRPLPTAKFGETLDCSQKTTTQTNANFQGPKTPPVASPSAGTVSINITNGETVNSPLPTFSGKSGPNQIVQIQVHSSTPYSGTVQADPSGNWTWTPPANLSPGQHTVTVTVVNADGTSQTLTRTFTVEASSPILPVTSGTPSAILSHFACVNSACVQVSGAGSDSCATNQDCISISTPSAIPVPTPLPPQPITPPTTGSLENTLVLLTLGLIFATLGLGFFLKNG